MAAAMMQRTYCVLRSFRSPGKALLVRGKAKSSKKKVEANEGPKDYVYFLHNHVVPLHSFEEGIEKLKEFSVEGNKDPQQTVTMCMKCQGLDKVGSVKLYKYLLELYRSIQSRVEKMLNRFF
jgi:hypothetical protein